MDALILTDLQNDFLAGGALAVPDGDAVIPVANRLVRVFELVVATQDWHPPEHGSFASNHPGAKPGDRTILGGLDQELWPDHCVQGTLGADFSPAVNMNPVEAIFRKGTDPEIDSYSGFFDNGHLKSTGMADYLRGRGVDTIYLVGLAGDFCVWYSARDALHMGFHVVVVRDGTRPISEGAYGVILKALQEMGGQVMESRQIA